MFNFIYAAVEFKLPEGFFAESGNKTVYIVLSVVAIVACIAILILLGGKKKANVSKEVAYGGVLIALATVLSMVSIYEMPQGGTVTPASILPIALYAYIFGVRKGLFIGFIYGIIQALMGGYVVHPIQFLLDYPIAFAMMGLTGLFRNKFGSWGALIGFLIAVLARYLVHSLGGMVFFANYAASSQFWDVFVYSFGYNSFVFVDAAIAIALGAVLFSVKSFRHLIHDAAN